MNNFGAIVLLPQIRLLLILSLALSWNTGKADSPEEQINWRQEVLRSEAPLVEMPAAALEQFDFGHILIDGRTDYLGYIGEDYLRLHIFFNAIEKVSPTKYLVTGYSKVRSNRCDFSGTIEIKALYEKTNLDLGVDNEMEGKVKQQGIVVADFAFAESREQAGSGLFNGSLITRWYVGLNDKLLYDDINNYSDDYSNNQFSGRWTSYRTHASKRCAWGHWQIPFSGDLDIGAAEFSVNPKYIDNGWDNTEREVPSITAYTSFNKQICP